MSSPRIGYLSHRALSNMRDRTGRVAGRLSCGPLCIPVFPLGGKQPGPILCQTAWISKSTVETGTVLSSGSEFRGHAANSEDTIPISASHTKGEPSSSNRLQPFPPHDREQPQGRAAGPFLGYGDFALNLPLHSPHPSNSTPSIRANLRSNVIVRSAPSCLPIR